jgi:hypothetical protein
VLRRRHQRDVLCRKRHGELHELPKTQAHVTRVLEIALFEARAKRLKGDTFTFDVKTVTGTENLMMAATLARGTTNKKALAGEGSGITGLPSREGGRKSGQETLCGSAQTIWATPEVWTINAIV